MAMPEPAITANLDQALDIEINLFSKVTLNPVLFVDNLSKVIDFLLGKVLNPRIRGDLGLSQNPLAQGGTDAVNILQ